MATREASALGILCGHWAVETAVAVILSHVLAKNKGRRHSRTETEHEKGPEHSWTTLACPSARC